jgi:hypothetical protein
MLMVDETLAKVLVDEVGIETTLRILEKAEEAFEEKHPGFDLNPTYVRMRGVAKEYEVEKNVEKGLEKNGGTKKN